MRLRWSVSWLALIVVFCSVELGRATTYETDPDRPGEIFIPDAGGEGGWWYRLRPGETIDTVSGGLSAGLVRRMQRQLKQGLKAPEDGEAKTCWAAITCYWQNGTETDRWTRRGQSSTGVRLQRGVVAVDPKVIPYGSMLKIEGVEGYFIAADCGRDVQKRVAVKMTAHTATEKKAVVVDVFFKNEKEGRQFDHNLPAFVKVRYYSPTLIARR